MSPNDFTQKILCDYLHTKHLIIGYDHKFGKNRAGNYAFLKENESKFGFKVQEITKQEIDDVAVSSTKIRNALLIGDVKMANEYLESTYQLTGMVVKGNQIGRTLGFPTANLQLTDAQKLIPANGIYAVTVFIKNQFYKAVLSIGVRPTIGDNLEKTVEVNIFDFNEDIYGEKITLNFYQYLRPEQKFDSLEDLVKQMNLDKKQALEFLNSRF
jgi:riboflavin kinase/FMN adenylyltransferase